MKKKFLAGLAAGWMLFCLLEIKTTAAANFTDGFDSVIYTDSNWTSMFPQESSWTYENAAGDIYEGYHGEAYGANSAALGRDLR